MLAPAGSTNAVEKASEKEYKTINSKSYTKTDIKVIIKNGVIKVDKKSPYLPYKLQADTTEFKYE